MSLATEQLNLNHPDYQFKKNEMSRACSIYGGQKGTCRVLVRKRVGENHLEDPGVDGRITIKWIFKK
jgi:hypothetical protein